MNKISTFLLLNLGLIFCASTFAAVDEIIDSSFKPEQHLIISADYKTPDTATDKIQRFKLIVADNDHQHEADEITVEIDELNKEMSEMGKEFGKEMQQMGEELKGLVKMLRKMGDKESGKGAFLGILLDEHKGVDEGILLLGVTPDGPAQKAGLQADDVITSINQQSMAKSQDMSPASKLYKSMKKVKPGEQLDLLIIRDGEEKNIIFNAGKRGDHLQSGINFLADDLEKRISKNIHSEMDHEAFAGIELYPVNDQLGQYFGADKGMLVLKIADNNKFQLQQGDIIVKIGDRFPKSTSHTWRILESYERGENINLTLMRKQKEIRISINKP